MLGLVLASVGACSGRRATPPRGASVQAHAGSGGGKTPEAAPAPAPAAPADSAVLTGVVRDAHGAAVANARILCWAVDGDKAVPIKEARSDGRGAFTLQRLHPGRHKLMVEAPGFDTSSFTAVAPANSLVLPLGGESRSVNGVVLGPDGHPVGGARVVLLAGEDVATRETASDEDGEFTFPDVEPGMYRLRAMFGRASSEVHPGITLGDSESLPQLELRLVPGVWLSGTVTDSAGRPVGGAEVLIDAEPETGVPEVLRTDAQGRWEAGAVPLGRYHIQARLPGYVMHSPDIVVVSGAHSRSQHETLTLTKGSARQHHKSRRALQAKTFRTNATR